MFSQPTPSPHTHNTQNTETKDTPDAPAAAKRELEKLGPMSRDEKITAGAFLLTVALWIGGAAWGVNSVAAATVGLAILLVTGVVSWKECLSNNAAWDTLTWCARGGGVLGCSSCSAACGTRGGSWWDAAACLQRTQTHATRATHAPTPRFAALIAMAPYLNKFCPLTPHPTVASD